jgi:hypothetical protein
MTVWSPIDVGVNENRQSPTMIAGVDVLSRAVWAEVGYRATDGGVDAIPLVPLTAAGAPLFALPYAERALAEEIAASGVVCVAVTDGRLAFSGWQPTAVSGRIRLEADVAGTAFREDLLDEELRKHPPSRLLADSLVQRREHWWFLPRLLLRLDRVERTDPMTARQGGDDGVLFWGEGTELRATTVSADDWSSAEPRVLPLGGGVPPSRSRACLLRHDFSPDLERRAVLRLRGEYRDGRLLVTDRQGLLELPAPLGLWARWRRLRAFERACRRELRRAEPSGHG